MKTTVLIISYETDESVAPVHDRLVKMGHQPAWLNLSELVASSGMTIRLSGELLTGSIRPIRSEGPAPPVRWEDIKSVWYRRTRPQQENSVLHPGHQRFVDDETEAALWSLYTTLDAFWVNPPLVSQYLLEHNKLYQARVAAQCGLRVPDTIITNDSDALLSFCRERNGVVAVKPLKGNIFRHEDRPDNLLVYTQRLTEDDILLHRSDIALCPVFAQEYIDKLLEYRVTIVGDEIFACAIHSQDSPLTRHDWRRYDFEHVAHEATDLPTLIRQQLLQFMRTWKLPFGALDIALTPTGSYVFFEINPSGQWLWIEQLTGLPISTAIARLLSNASCGDALPPATSAE